MSLTSPGCAATAAECEPWRDMRPPLLPRSPAAGAPPSACPSNRRYRRRAPHQIASIPPSAAGEKVKSIVGRSGANTPSPTTKIETAPPSLTNIGTPPATQLLSVGEGVHYTLNRFVDFRFENGWQLRKAPGERSRGSRLIFSVVVGN